MSTGRCAERLLVRLCCRERQDQDKAYFEEQQAAQATAHRKAWEVDVQEKKR